MKRNNAFDEIKKNKKPKIKEQQIHTINTFTIAIDIIKEIFKFIFYNHKKDMINLRLCCKTFRNLCSPYWKQSVPSLTLDEYFLNINRMGFEIGELDIIEINYSNIFTKLPKNITKLTVIKETNSKDLRYLPANIEYLNLDKMDYLNIRFSDIPKTVKFLSLEHKFFEKSNLKFIKNFCNPNIYLQKFINNDYEHQPLLFFTIENNNEQYLLYLLQNGANINQRDNNGKNALMIAIQYGHLELVKLLIKNGVNINEKDNYNCTPLHYTTKYARLKIFYLLIENGANVINLLIFLT